jgi:hypothetical protein
MRVIRVRVPVPAGLTEDVEIVVELEPQEQASPRPRPDPAVEADLSVLAGRASASPDLREAAEGLLGMKYRLVKMDTAGKPEYVRFMDPFYPGHGCGELHANHLLFTRGPHREQLARMPGADERSNGVRFSIAGGIDQAMAAAAAVKLQSHA